MQPQRGSRVAAAEHLDVTGGNPTAQSLDRGLLGGESRSKVPAGSGPGIRERQLARPEQSLGQPGAPKQRPLDSLDLDQVDPDAGRRGIRGQGVITAAEVSSVSAGASLTPTTKAPVVRSPSSLLPLTTKSRRSK